MPSVTIREFNPTTGALMGNISALSFGRVSTGRHSPVKVIDYVFTGVSSVENVKVGLVDAGGLTVNESPENIGSDGSASNGRFGIEHGSSFDSVTAAGPLTRHFAGENTTGAGGDPFNVRIGTRNDTTSQYVYIDIELAAGDSGKIGGSFKVFFDFE